MKGKRAHKIKPTRFSFVNAQNEKKQAIQGAFIRNELSLHK